MYDGFMTVAMWVICLTTDSDSCNIDYLLKDKSFVISHYCK